MIYQYCAAFTDREHHWKITNIPTHQTHNPTTISRSHMIFRDDWKHWVSWWLTDSFQLFSNFSLKWPGISSSSAAGSRTERPPETDLDSVVLFASSVAASPWWFVCILHVNHKAQRGHHTMWHRQLASVHTVRLPHTLSSFCQNWQIVGAFSSLAWTLCDLTSKYDTSENPAWMFLPPKVFQHHPTEMLKLIPAQF